MNKFVIGGVSLVAGALLGSDLKAKSYIYYGAHSAVYRMNEEYKHAMKTHCNEDQIANILADVRNDPSDTAFEISQKYKNAFERRYRN